jgi:hypothetical protein
VLCMDGDVYTSIGARKEMLERVAGRVERVEVSRWGVHMLMKEDKTL